MSQHDAARVLLRKRSVAFLIETYFDPIKYNCLRRTSSEKWPRARSWFLDAPNLFQNANERDALQSNQHRYYTICIDSKSPPVSLVCRLNNLSHTHTHKLFLIRLTNFEITRIRNSDDARRWHIFRYRRESLYLVVVCATRVMLSRARAKSEAWTGKKSRPTTDAHIHGQTHSLPGPKRNVIRVIWAWMSECVLKHFIYVYGVLHYRASQWRSHFKVNRNLACVCVWMPSDPDWNPVFLCAIDDDNDDGTRWAWKSESIEHFRIGKCKWPKT